MALLGEDECLRAICVCICVCVWHDITVTIARGGVGGDAEDPRLPQFEWYHPCAYTGGSSHPTYIRISFCAFDAITWMVSIAIGTRV